MDTSRKHSSSIALATSCLMLFAGNLVVAFAGDTASKERQEIEDAFKRKDCFAASELVRAAIATSPNSSSIPEWNYRLIQCYGGKRDGFGDAIRHYFDKEVAIQAKNKPCSNLENYVSGIDKKFDDYVNRADWLYSVARCYESENQQKAVAKSRQIFLRFPKTEAAVYAEFRLKWIQGDRKWVYPSLNDLMQKVRKAVVSRDVRALSQYASKSRFRKSFGEQGEAVPFDTGPGLELAEAFKRSRPLIGDINAKETNLYLMEVVLPDEEYPFWYFEFRNLDGGWQWTGINVLPQTGRGAK